MLTRTFTTTALLCAGLLAQAPALAATTGNFGVFLGQKSLDNSDWGEQDTHAALAILADFREKSWPISVAIGIAGSGDVQDTPDGDVTAATSETMVGIRKLFAENGRVQPYLGGGVALIEAELETPFVTHNDSGLGFWLNAGVYFSLAEHFSLGIDYRYSQAEVTLGRTDVDAGGDHVGVIASYHW